MTPQYNLFFTDVKNVRLEGEPKQRRTLRTLSQMSNFCLKMLNLIKVCLKTSKIKLLFGIQHVSFREKFEIITKDVSKKRYTSWPPRWIGKLFRKVIVYFLHVLIQSTHIWAPIEPMICQIQPRQRIRNEDLSWFLRYKLSQKVEIKLNWAWILGLWKKKLSSALQSRFYVISQVIDRMLMKPPHFEVKILRKRWITFQKHQLILFFAGNF